MKGKILSKTLEGWNCIDKGIPRREDLEEWIERYFTEKPNLSDFYKRNNVVGNGLELMRGDESEGYVFVDKLVDGKYEERMQTIRVIYNNSGKKVSRYFVDLENHLAGFSWRRD